MSLVLFVLGRPGCGKSTAMAYIRELAQAQELRTIRLKDYEKLYRRFQAEVTAKEEGPKRFRGAAYGGFDILDFTVMDEVLAELQQELQNALSIPENKLIIVEFARDEYCKPLRQFRQDLLQNAYFLFVDTNLEACIQRIHQRVKNPVRADNHFVSDTILRDYYSKDTLFDIKDKLAREPGIESRRITILNNNDSQTQFLEEVEQFFYRLFPALLPISTH
ncbi:MAG TPA: hypothetical protein VFU49_00530 [Ktedonobacteraceae bacterium]|nr:hypothetical protein [Ktedonobacteraceae bacterium]